MSGATTQAASAENAQTTAAATPKENLSVPPESDQSVSSVSSVPSVQTPSGTAAPVEQVGEQGKKGKTTIADLNQQAKAKREAKQGKAETATAEQTNDTVMVDKIETITLNSVTEITDEDFNNPTRSIILPSLPQKLLNLISKKSKPVLLKKNILEKNKNNHPELSAEDNRKILDAALYHSELIGQSQPDKRPNYWVAVKLDSGKNAVVVFDMEETKTHHEIVGWHFANEKGLANLQKQAVREGGQILDMRNNSQSPSDQTGTDTTNTIPPSAEKSSGDSEKIISKITSAKAGSRERIMVFTELPDGEHTVNGKTFAKSGNAFTFDGKTLNAKEIEKATRTTSEKMRKTVEETVSDAEIGYTPQTEAKPEKEPTLSDKMRGKGKKETAVPSAEKSAPEKTDESGNRILFTKTGNLNEKSDQKN